MDLWPALSFYLDVNWVDAGAIVGACIYALFKWKTAEPPRPFIQAETGYDFASGAALFPLCILALSVFSSWLIRELTSASRVTLSVAGVVALLALLEQDT